MVINKSKQMLVVIIFISFLVQFPQQVSLANQAEEFGQQEASLTADVESSRGSLISSEGKHLLLVLIPQLSFADLPDLLGGLDPAVRQQLKFAAMSMRTAGGMNLHNNLFTLSTGERSLGLANWNAYHQDEELQGKLARDIYIRWGGKQTIAPILHPGIFQLQQQWGNHGLSTARLGWLGPQLTEQEIFAAGFGNSDTLESKQRLATAFVMNPNGEAQGIVDEQILSTDVYFPTGKKTDWVKLSTEIASIWQSKNSSFIAVELGDLERFYAEEKHMQGNYAHQVRETWFKEWANWQEELITLSDKVNISLEIWTLSPMVSSQAKREGKLLAPFLTWSNHQQQSLLSSSSTKQAGIITNVDLLPSICTYFGLGKPKQLIGQVIQASEEVEVGSWLQFLDYLFLIYTARRKVITTYISIVICLLILTTGYWWLERTRKEARQGIRITIGGILVSPLYFLWLTPLIKWLQEWQWITILLLFSIVTSWLLTKLCSDDALYLAIIGFVNTLFILLDIVQGSPRMMRSFLGYDPIIGARFYGLGNEYAGFLLGSSLLAVIASYVWLNRKGIFTGLHGWRLKCLFLGGTFFYYTVILYLIAAPNYGTNLGATLASVATYALLLITLFTFGWNWKWLLASFGALGLGIAGFLYLHMQAEHTHIGAALGLILAGDVDSFLAIVHRKWEMNMRLIRVSLWGKLFVTSLLVLGIILFRLRWKKKQISLDMWFQGFRVIVAGSILILLVNDSGVVAAATTMIYVTFPFMYLRFS